MNGYFVLVLCGISFSAGIALHDKAYSVVEPEKAEALAALKKRLENTDKFSEEAKLRAKHLGNTNK